MAALERRVVELEDRLAAAAAAADSGVLAGQARAKCEEEGLPEEIGGPSPTPAAAGGGSACGPASAQPAGGEWIQKEIVERSVAVAPVIRANLLAQAGRPVVEQRVRALRNVALHVLNVPMAGMRHLCQAGLNAVQRAVAGPRRRCNQLRWGP